MSARRKSVINNYEFSLKVNPSANQFEEDRPQGTNKMFKALLLDKTDAGFAAVMAELNESQLPTGDVRGRV